MNNINNINNINTADINNANPADAIDVSNGDMLTAVHDMYAKMQEMAAEIKELKAELAGRPAVDTPPVEAITDIDSIYNLSRYKNANFWATAYQDYRNDLADKIHSIPSDALFKYSSNAIHQLPFLSPRSRNYIIELMDTYTPKIEETDIVDQNKDKVDDINFYSFSLRQTRDTIVGEEIITIGLTNKYPASEYFKTILGSENSAYDIDAYLLHLPQPKTFTVGGDEPADFTANYIIISRGWY